MSEAAPDTTVHAYQPFFEMPAEALPSALYSEEARQAFQEHVARVRERGDPFDVTMLTRRAVLNRTLLPLAVLGPFTAGIQMEAGPVTTSSLIGILAGCAIMIGGIRRVSRRFPPRVTGAYGALGEDYELFRTRRENEDGGPRMVMRYYGPLRERTDENDQPITMNEHVRAMADLAEQNGIDTMMMNKGIALRATTSTRLKTQPMRDALKDMKGISVDPGYLYDLVAATSPKAWRELPPSQIRFEEDGNDAISGLIQKLQAIRPDHPLVSSAQAHKDYPEQRRRVLSRQVREAIERELSDISGGSKRDQIRSADGLRPRSYLAAVPEANTGNITWSNKGLVVHTSPIEAALGLSEDEAVMLLKYPHIEPNKAYQLILGRLVRALELPKDAPNTAQLSQVAESTPPSKANGGISVYNALLNNTDAHKLKYAPVRRSLKCKAAVGVLSLLASGVGAFAASHTMNEYYEDSTQRAKHTLALERGMEPDYIPIGDAEAYAENTSTLLAAWGKVRDGYDAYVQAGGEKGLNGGAGAAPPPPQPSVYSPYSGVGDVDKASWPRPEWKVYSQGDISSAGFWAWQTMPNFRIQLAPENRALQWQSSDEVTTPVDIIPLPSVPPGDGDYLRVSFDKAPSDTLGQYASIMRIPVRTGTIPVAAELNGQPLGLHRHTDGTYMLVSDPKLPTEGELHYWLQEVPQAPGPYANGPVIGEVSAEEIQRIVQLWERRIPGFAAKSAKEQVAAMEGYIAANFDYRVAFLGNPTAVDDSMPNLTQGLLEKERANCQMASTLLLGGNLQKAAEFPLVPLTGYLNIAGYDNLSSREGHMLTVDQDGTLHDPTPIKGATLEDIAFLHGAVPETPRPDTRMLWALGGVGGLALAGGSIFMSWPYMRRARRLIRTHRTQSLEKALTATDATVLNAATHVSEALAWDANQDIPAALARANRPSSALSAPSPEPLEKIRQPYIHGKHIQVLIKSQASLVSGQHRVLLRQIGRVLRKAEKLERRRQPQNDPQGIY